MRRRLTLFAVVVVAASTLVAVPAHAIPAHAIPAPDPAPNPSASALGPDAGRATLGDPGATGKGLRAQDVPTRQQEALHRLDYRTQPNNVITCHDDPFGRQLGGFVISHAAFCQDMPAKLRLEHEVCEWPTPFGCLKSKKTELGNVEFDITVIGYGWDATMIDPNDHVDPKYNQISFVTLVHNFRNIRGAALEFPLKLDIVCTAEIDRFCFTDSLYRAQVKPVAEWMRDGGQIIRFLQEPDAGVGPDTISVYDFNYVLNDVPGWERAGALGNTYRCDKAGYTKGGRGCVFQDLESVFARLKLDPAQKYFEEVQHIADLFFRPELTVPRPPEGQRKDVPGNLLAANGRPIMRSYEPYSDGLNRRNHDTAVAACVAEWGPNYTQDPDGRDRSCDEYPFQSTFQGASKASPSWNFGARRILATHNSSGGGVLGDWYGEERILHGDQFYVFVDGAGAGGGGGGGSVPGWPDQPPSVSAGPDVTGDEGATLHLRGAAADVEGPVTTGWTYAAVSGVDPGATCSFGSSGRAATSFTCTDDGTYRVTLTASDGVNAPVSASATVHVTNVAPVLDLSGPAPWQVFRARTGVPLKASFTDPGTNDTHTCAVDWDEGTAPQTYAAAGGSCDRTHTFAHAGMYTIKLTVTDDDGGSSQASTMVVVYDPEAGSTSGNGWVDAARQTGFAFTGSYPSAQATTPQGSLTYTVQSSGLNLRAHHDIEWVVVAPDHKIAMKGTGELITGRPVGFVLYGYDAAPDKLRMVIWDVATGPIPGNGPPIYDNRATASYDLDQAQPQPVEAGTVFIAYAS